MKMHGLAGDSDSPPRAAAAQAILCPDQTPEALPSFLHSTSELLDQTADRVESLIKNSGYDDLFNGLFRIFSSKTICLRNLERYEESLIAINKSISILEYLIFTLNRVPFKVELTLIELEKAYILKLSGHTEASSELAQPALARLETEVERSGLPVHQAALKKWRGIFGDSNKDLIPPG